MPSLNGFANAALGTVQVVGIATDSPERDVAQYVRKFGLSFAVAYDAGDRVAHSYGVRAFPTIYFLEPGGKIVGAARGAMDWSKAVPMIKELQRLKP